MSTISKHEMVVAIEDAKLFWAIKGRECEVLKQYFRNGEGHFELKDINTGEIFQSPDIFWE